MRSRPDTIDDYLATVSPDKRGALEKLRRAIRAAVPRAEECISYGVPAFRLDGKVLVWFAAAAHHCSFFPGAVLADYEEELQDSRPARGPSASSPTTCCPPPSSASW